MENTDKQTGEQSDELAWQCFTLGLRIASHALNHKWSWNDTTDAIAIARQIAASDFTLTIPPTEQQILPGYEDGHARIANSTTLNDKRVSQQIVNDVDQMLRSLE